MLDIEIRRLAFLGPENSVTNLTVTSLFRDLAQMFVEQERPHPTGPTAPRAGARCLYQPQEDSLGPHGHDCHGDEQLPYRHAVGGRFHATARSLWTRRWTATSNPFPTPSRTDFRLLVSHAKLLDDILSRRAPQHQRRTGLRRRVFPRNQQNSADAEEGLVKNDGENGDAEGEKKEQDDPGSRCLR